ncbi:hypothetical protein [Halomonas citrativorans]|uniref:Uncharacterized protein n=1 Tax=Halomonas citrativorans TaxID=2742612 RepID=A0ABR9F9C5_9GAMM|nr:hypothetical protein [Halomonas citrativorans]MBE0403092.1 hypothetical protein [Halomonas citrativorans]
MRTQIKQLLTPFRYLRIKNKAKCQIDFVIPLILGLTVAGVLVALGSHVSIFGDKGYVSLITGLLQILTGFYIAALAAVATFPSATLEQPLDGSPAILNEMRRGKLKPINLKRRPFLCFLFGHLALLSICLYFLGGFANLISNGIAELVSAQVAYWLRALFIVLYSIASAHLFVVTMLGIYYLSYRIHRPPSGNQANKEKPPTP